MYFMKYYLVGGLLRDMLLNRRRFSASPDPSASSDRQASSGADRRDCVFTGSPEELRTRYPDAVAAGRAFPVFLADGCEFSSLRGDGIDEDLLSRDLTVNALALGEDGILRMHPDAAVDILNKSLRPASSNSFTQDPLRIFRAARFAATLPGFSPHEELFEAMRSTASREILNDISPERIGDETRRALAGTLPGEFLRTLATGRALAPWFSELRDADDIPAGPAGYHDKSVLGHTAEVMDRLAGHPLRVWMALCHDLGKCLTPANKWPAHHGHDRRGEAAAQILARRLRLPSRWADAGAAAARGHLVLANYPALRPGTRVDLLMPLHNAGFLDDLLALCRADRRGRDPEADERERLVHRDINALLSTSLPRKWRDLGPDSGAHLRELRCEAIIRAAGKDGSAV